MGNFINLKGDTFGYLKVIQLNIQPAKRTRWECVCVCGSKTIVESHKLISGHTKSCGCKKGRSKEDLTGQTFNLLTALHIADFGIRTKWCCLCDCGNKKYVLAYNLKNGAVKSCGCLGKGNQTIHGLSHTALATTLDNMKGRCYRPNNNSYSCYGGRGITICDEWLQDTTNFYQWAFSNGYKRGLTIERIDCNGNYCPENCKWIPKYEQGRNTRTTLGVEKVLEIKMKLKAGEIPIRIAKEYGVHPSTIGYIKSGKAYPYVTIPFT